MTAGVVSNIEDYALVGDLHTAALIGRDGSVDWLCLPRFDSPACFAALLGDAGNGRWRIAPASADTATRRRYTDDTLILEAEWDTPDGTVRVTDFMPPRGQAADIVRIVDGVTGRVPMHAELTLRFDYGSVVPWLRRTPHGLTAVAGPDAVWLHTDVPLHNHDLTTTAAFTVEAGERVTFVLTHQPSYLPPPHPADPEQALRDTRRYWHDWISRHRYDGPYADAVRRSLILLKALTYAPTGGIVAAATTSLPE
ncbi:hypothetical protein Acsp02_93790 [Actinoplanes sp. NBRC 103695]|nr:hypothetical protein Acsp02_93790 [Actinoplanes sp. NBRC 103695]